ncbi:hypothetical protein SEA_KRAMPUS_82 [Microbacterium phage Krampus]|uniref:Uncharacterized protein n=1 Tax=Microbacterium phage Krampus TaxID=2201435 RepID=A0A2Z4Q541_9CAUD|nr:hypothetical protein HOT40_gp82 [Microbacterium phage Krampus]AWY05177.1 hypothetical protein SEA_KRAMPUS_82 [Microbacterium phage Krampus]
MMAHKKPLKACTYVLPHPQHVWTNNPTDKEEKFFCKGIAEPAHVHTWDNPKNMPIMRAPDGQAYVLFSPYDEDGEYWQGPFECSCGSSAWLKDGRKKRDLPAKAERFPKADSYERIVALKAKLDRGEEFTAEDKAELEAIGTALIEAVQPLIKAFEKMYEQMAEFITGFLDQIDPVLMAQLIEMSKAHGEKPDSVQTVEVRGSDGSLIAEHIVSYDPIPANQHAATDIVEDAEQEHVAFGAADGEAIGITVIGGPNDPITRAEANVILDGVGIALPRAQRFRSASEH